MYNGEQEFRPLPSGGLLPAEHGRNKSNSKAASRPIGESPDRCSPSCRVEGLPSGPVRPWSNVKSAGEKVSSSLYCCRVAVFFAGGFFSFLSPISSNPTYTT